MDDMLSAAVPRRLRIRTSIMFGNVRLPLRLFLVMLATGMAGVLLLVAGLPPVAAIGLVVLGNGLFALAVEARWGTQWANRSTRSLLCIWWRHLRRPGYLRLEPVPLELLPEPSGGVVRPVRWPVRYARPKGHRI